MGLRGECKHACRREHVEGCTGPPIGAHMLVMRTPAADDDADVSTGVRITCAYVHAHICTCVCVRVCMCACACARAYIIMTPFTHVWAGRTLGKLRHVHLQQGTLRMQQICILGTHTRRPWGGWWARGRRWQQRLPSALCAQQGAPLAAAQQQQGRQCARRAAARQQRGGPGWRGRRGAAPAPAAAAAAADARHVHCPRAPQRGGRQDRGGGGCGLSSGVETGAPVCVSV